MKMHDISCAIHVKLFGKLSVADVRVSADTPTTVCFSC